MAASLLALIILACCAATVLQLKTQLRCADQIKAVQRHLLRVAAVEREQQRLDASRRQIGELQNFAESTVDGSTQTVRAIHKGIADVPFDLLESIPAARDTTKLVRGIHDLTSDSVYGSISVLNKAFGKQFRKQLERRPGEAKPDDKTKGQP